tara:strand:+ start:412 stop:837 length:426 start_codon:yes stop_codon:yes gene_type:complete
MFNISPAKGFGNVAPNTYARSLGGLPEQQAQYETMLASAGLQGNKMKKIVKAKAKAAKYQGQQAGKDYARSGFMDGMFSAVSGVASGIGANMGSFGGASGGFSVGDATNMGMPLGQAEHIAGGGFTEWTTDMPLNAWRKYP